MKKVYVVTAGSYSDYHIIGIFSAKEKAEEFISSISDYMYNYESGDINKIEEYDLDSFDWWAQQKSRGLYPWRVSMYRDGRSGCHRIYIYTDNMCVEESEGFDMDTDKYSPMTYTHHVYLYVTCWATSKEHAVKIANEKRVQLIASGEWDKRADEIVEKIKKDSFLKIK